MIMKKVCILLMLVLCVSNSYSQEQRYDEFRCPVGESKDNTSFGYWDKYNLYYYIHNYPTNSNLTSAQCDAAIQSAFNKWSEYSIFTFSRTYDLSQADIELKWLTGHHINCYNGYFQIGEAAHASPGKTNQTPPGYIHFNDDISFTTTSSGYNLEVIALHEIGHVIGLEHDTSHPTAVMYSDGSYHYNIDITSYDYNSLYNIYGFPTYIEGPNYISSFGDYSLNNLDKLPSNFSVSWILSGNYNNDYLHFARNYPEKGKCRIIRNEYQDMMNDTLTAIIKKGDLTIKTLTMKGLYAYDGFWAQYTSGNLSGNIDYTFFFNIKANNFTTIFSPNFYGATVSYSSSGAIPSSWSHNPNTGVVSFYTTNTSAPVIIYVHDCCGNDYVLYAYPSSLYSINASNGVNFITVTLVEDGDASKNFTPNQSWTIEVRSAATGELMTTQSSTNRSETISTIGWPKGIYVVKVTIGKEELTEKVIVK